MLTIRQEIERHHARLKKMAMNIASGDHHKSDDLMQDAVERLIRYEDRFEPGSNFLGWAYIMMRNIFLNKCAKDGKLNEVFVEAENISSVIKSGIQLQDAELKEAMAGLSDNQRIALELSLDGYSGQEIADILNIPCGSVRSRIHYAKQNLRKKLEGHNAQ